MGRGLPGGAMVDADMGVARARREIGRQGDDPLAAPPG
jgi:hypothetical protein